MVRSASRGSLSLRRCCTHITTPFLWIGKIPELRHIALVPLVTHALTQLRRCPSFVVAAVLKVWLNASPSRRRFGNKQTVCTYSCGVHYDYIRHYIQCRRFISHASKVLEFECSANPLCSLGLSENSVICLRGFTFLYAHHIRQGHQLHGSDMHIPIDDFLAEQKNFVLGESATLRAAFSSRPNPIVERLPKIPVWQASNSSAPDFQSSTDSMSD